MNKTKEIEAKEAIMREILAQGNELMDEMAAYTEMLKKRNRKYAIITIAIVVVFLLWLVLVFGWLV